ncbi:hypothetical protein [Rhizobium redzepovicii]
MATEQSSAEKAQQVVDIIVKLPREEQRKVLEELKRHAILSGCNIHTCGTKQHKHI